jgi:hypothetical protein
MLLANHKLKFSADLTQLSITDNSEVGPTIIVSFDRSENCKMLLGLK